MNRLPHVIRGQVNALAAEGKEPDILVNLTMTAGFGARANWTCTWPAACFEPSSAASRC